MIAIIGKKYREFKKWEDEHYWLCFFGCWFLMFFMVLLFGDG
jgi:hypothetical protein